MRSIILKWFRASSLFFKPPELPRAKPEVTWQEELWLRMDDGPAYLGSAEVWAVKSSSDPKGVHYVLGLLGRTVCTCKGFRYVGKCRHLKLTEGSGT